MKNTGLHGYVYDFSVYYDAIAVDHSLDIYKYLKMNRIWVAQNKVKHKQRVEW